MKITDLIKKLFKKEPKSIWDGEPEWRKQGRERNRFLVRARDNFTCQECKKIWKKGQKHFDVHHKNGLCGKKSRAYDTVEEMDGLITLCHKCHYGRHDISKEVGKKRIYGEEKKIRDAKIIMAIRGGATYKEMAKKFKISTAMVNNIYLGKK